MRVWCRHYRSSRLPSEQMECELTQYREESGLNHILSNIHISSMSAPKKPRGATPYPLTQPWSILSPIFWTALEAVAEMTWPKRTAERKRNMSCLRAKDLYARSRVLPNCSQLFHGRIPKCTPANIAHKQQMGGSKISHLNSSCSQIWPICMYVM